MLRDEAKYFLETTKQTLSQWEKEYETKGIDYWTSLSKEERKAFERVHVWNNAKEIQKEIISFLRDWKKHIKEKVK